MSSIKAPMSQETLSHSSGIFNVPSASDAVSCSAALGRDCEVNSLSESGEFGSFTDTSAVDAVGTAESVWEAVPASEVSSANAGVGKLSSAGVATNSNAIANVAVVNGTESASSNSSAATSGPSTGNTASESESSATASATTTSAKASNTSTAAASPTQGDAECSVVYASDSSVETATRYARCGGKGWNGSTTCADGSTCTVVNNYYSQCT